MQNKLLASTFFSQNGNHKYTKSSHSSNTFSNTELQSLSSTQNILCNRQNFSSTQTLSFKSQNLRNKQEDVDVLIMKVQKYEKMQKYVDVLIEKNMSLEDKVAMLTSQSAYLQKDLQQMKAMCDSMQLLLETRIKQVEKQVEMEKNGKNIVKLENDRCMTRIKHLNFDIEEFKKSIELTLTDKVIMEQQLKEIKQDNKRICEQASKLESFNKEILISYKNKEDAYIAKVENGEKRIENCMAKIEQLMDTIEEMKSKADYAHEKLQKQGAKCKGLMADNADLQLKYQKSVNAHKELEGLVMEYQRRISVREQQLKEVQQFREEERSKYEAEMNAMKNKLQQQSLDFSKAIEHKILKNDKLIHINNELIEKINSSKVLVAQLQCEVDQQRKKNEELHYQISQKMKEIEHLKDELIQERENQQKMKDDKKGLQQQCENSRALKVQIQKQIKNKEIEHMEHLMEVKKKYDEDRHKWQQFTKQEKDKLKQMHEFDIKEIENLYKSKILALEEEFEKYKSRANLGSHKATIKDKNLRGKENEGQQKNNTTMGQKENGRLLKDKMKFDNKNSKSQFDRERVVLGEINTDN